MVISIGAESVSMNLTDCTNAERTQTITKIKTDGVTTARKNNGIINYAEYTYLARHMNS